MRNDSFICVMHRLFSWLFFGSIALLLLWLVGIPIALIRQDTFTANRNKQIRYDTLLTAHGTSSWSTPVLDNTGQYISKIEWQSQHLNYYGKNGELIARLLFGSLKQSADTLRLLREKQSPQIDSVLLADPYASIYQLPDRWFVGHNQVFNGFMFAPELPFEVISSRKTLISF